MLLRIKNNQRRLVQQIVSQFRGHLFITTLRTSPPALLRLVRQRNGIQVFILLDTLALNLLHRNGFRSIRAGLMAVAYDIRRMLGWVGIRPMEAG